MGGRSARLLACTLDNWVCSPPALTARRRAFASAESIGGQGRCAQRVLGGVLNRTPPPVLHFSQSLFFHQQYPCAGHHLQWLVAGALHFAGV